MPTSKEKTAAWSVAWEEAAAAVRLGSARFGRARRAGGTKPDRPVGHSRARKKGGVEGGGDFCCACGARAGVGGCVGSGDGGGGAQHKRLPLLPRRLALWGNVPAKCQKRARGDIRTYH
eukprot:6107054-Pleurochrysis_carterae.AAC.1